MEIIKFNEMKKTWFRIAKFNDGNIDPTFELEVHKKLLNVFQVGNYYYYILNIPKVEFEFINDSIVDILGLKNKSDFNVKYIFDKIHPDDRNRFIIYEQKVTDFFNELRPDQITKYKVSYDYRLKKTDGTYIWILQQVTTIQSYENGAVIRVLGIHTDITHLKTDDKGSGLSFIGLDGEPSYYNIDIDQKYLGNPRYNELFTSKEKEILQLVVEGKTTKEISEILNKSIHTINTHRKNIFQKTESKTIAELVANCIKNNWI